MASRQRTVPTVQLWMVAGLALAMTLSSLDALYPRNTLLQHAPTLAVVASASMILKRWPLSTVSVACIFIFFLLHCLGARYSYSFVPYDAWTQQFLGISVNGAFGFGRNHYDRLVHLCFGLLAIHPVREVAARHFRVPPGIALYVAPEFVLAFSASYEMFEWLLAVTMNPADADAYNGQQGDMFDSQKDMALAGLGALVAAAWQWRTYLSSAGR